MQTNEHNAEKERNSRDKIYLVIIILLLISNGILIWQLIQKGQNVEVLATENVDLTADKEAIQVELDNLEFDFSNLQTDNVEMNAQIDSQMVKIEAMKAELAAADGNKASMQRIIRDLRKETETLRRIMQHYVVTIDSLNTLNVALRENLAVRDGQLTEATTNIEDLTSAKTNLEGQVKIGARLKTDGVTAEALRLRSGGGQTDTKRAKNTDMIKTCFSIRENALAKSGERNFYIRIIKPDGSVLTPADKDTHFEWDGGTGLYSVKYAKAYNNKAMELCVYCNVEVDELPAGNYLTQIYSDGSMIGSTNFELK